VCSSDLVASVFAADAGGEAGINFIRLSETAPTRLDWATGNVRNQADTNLEGLSQYSYNANFLLRQARQGWMDDYYDYDYKIGALGTASQKGVSGVDVVVRRLYREGY